MSCTTSQQDALDTLKILRGQEDNSYWLGSLYAESRSSDDDRSVALPEYCGEDIVNFFQWRRDMVKWCLDVASMKDIQLETVEVALSILDRFVYNDEEVMRDPELFRLASMASLYIACKTHEKKTISMKQMEELSCREFSREEFEYMEIHILYTVKWRVNPPTSISFARNLLNLLPAGVVPERSVILQTLENQIQSLLSDELFLTTKASTIALGGLVNAFYPLLGDVDLNDMFHHFQCALSLEKEGSSLPALQSELQKVVRLLSDGSLDSCSFATSDLFSVAEPEGCCSTNSMLHHKDEIILSNSPRSVVSEA